MVLDRLVIKDEPRLFDSIETAWNHAASYVKVEFPGFTTAGKPVRSNDLQISDSGTVFLLFSRELRCLSCGAGVCGNHVEKPQPLLFSFNHPLGACAECKGFGNRLEYTEDAVVPDKELSLEQGAIEPWSKPSFRWWYRQFAKVARKKGIKLDVPYKDLPGKARELIFRGDNDFYGVNEFFEKLEGKRD